MSRSNLSAKYLFSTSNLKDRTRIGKKLSIIDNCKCFSRPDDPKATLILVEKSILFVKVLINMTHLQQPLDLLVNGWVKQGMRGF